MPRGRRPTRWLGLLAAALAACATPAPTAAPRFQPYSLAPQPEDEGEGEQVPAAPGSAAAAVAEDTPAARLGVALMRFAVQQRSFRTLTPNGEPMPEAARAGWATLFAAVDRLLRQPVEKTVPLDVIRARVAIDAEIDMDLGKYAELPDGLGASARARSMALEQRLTSVRRLAHPAAAEAGRLLWPVDRVVVTSLFGFRTDPFSKTESAHRGVDLRADPGQLIGAAAAGTVIRAGPAGGHGLHVEIEHGGHLTTSYSHLSVVLVAVGQKIPAKGPVGLAGSTGRSTGPHLHFEVWRDGQAVDPLGELMDPAVQDISPVNVGSGE